MIRRDIIAALKRAYSKPDSLVIGAAIGAGMTADAAVRGGADFLIALNAGRIRMMGGPSIGCMLPIGRTNETVASFARREILPRCPVPVFIGVAAMDPFLDLDELLADIRAWGFAGVVNFPSAIFTSHRFREQLERTGLGFARELDLLRRARDFDLASLAYVSTLTEAREAAFCDIVNINFGWNKGGIYGQESPLSIDDVGGHARELVSTIRQSSPETISLLEGGPIVNAEEFIAVAQESRAHGYIGGSTIDRLSMECAVAEKTSSFKMAHILRYRREGERERLDKFAARLNLEWRTNSMRGVMTTLKQATRNELPVIITGEVGAGRRTIARSLHAAGRRRSKPLRSLHCSEGRDEEAELELFGCEGADTDGTVRRRLSLLEAAYGSTLLLHNLHCAGHRLQSRLSEVLEEGSFFRINGTRWRPVDFRCVVTLETGPAAAPSNFIESGLRNRLGVQEIVVPPLRDRYEDLPILVEGVLRQMQTPLSQKDLDSEAIAVLTSHDWPQNIAELRRVIERSVLTAGRHALSAAALRDIIEESRASTRQRVLPTDERNWILDGLRRNRFRRAETARYLGISRKTLYNKMQKYQVFDGAAASSGRRRN